MKRVPGEGIIGRAALREAATSELTQVMNLVRAALQARYDAAKPVGASYVWFDIEAMYADRVIVCKDGRYWQFDYTIDAANNVQLAEPKEVIEQFLPVAMKEALAAERAHRTVLVAADDSAAFFIEAVEGTELGAAFDAVIIRAGLAKNQDKTLYPEEALREGAAQFEGARMYAKADIEHLKPAAGGNVNQLVGWISDARFVEGKQAGSGYIAGKANFLEGDLRTKIADAWKRGKRDLVALSIDAVGAVRKANMKEAALGAKRVAASILKVNSVDVITNASAGGALVRLVEAADPHHQEHDPMKEKMLAAIKAKFPNVDVASLSEDQILARYAEAIAPAQSGDFVTRAELEAQNRLAALREGAKARVDATKLPAPAKGELYARFAEASAEELTEAKVDETIKAKREAVARLAEALGVDKGKVQLEAGDIEVGDRSVQIRDMLEAFFDVKHKNHRSVQSFKECYIEITGDRAVTGRLENCNRVRLAESLGAAFREGLDTAAFSNVLGSTLNRRLVAEYGNITQFDGYRAITGEPVPLTDFRTNERVRYGGFGDLPIVAESGAYLDPDAPTDEKASYAAKKRGRTVSVTLEMVKNDDVGAIRRIPVRVGRSAKRTLAKFVFDFVVNNAATTYDGVNWFHANHGNLGAAALDATSLAARRLAMLKQTEKDSGDRLNLNPATLCVPLDLQEAAVNLFNRNTNLDKTFVNAMSLNIVPVWYWTDANDWALFADPMDSQVFELGFLDGQQEPQLFVQDVPNVGSMFTNDEITYKIRHIYGGDVIDHRGADKSVVA